MARLQKKLLESNRVRWINFYPRYLNSMNEKIDAKDLLGGTFQCLYFPVNCRELHPATVHSFSNLLSMQLRGDICVDNRRLQSSLLLRKGTQYITINNRKKHLFLQKHIADMRRSPVSKGFILPAVSYRSSNGRSSNGRINL